MQSSYKILSLILILALSSSCSLFKKAQKEEAVIEEAKPAEITWISIEEAEAKAKSEPKKILVDMYTDWCHWCKVMDKNTFSNEVIIDLVNEDFYAVKLDGETKDTLNFQGKDYFFRTKPGSNRGFHELAYALSGGRLSYPTIVFLDESTQMLQPIPGYKKPTDMEAILTYFGQGFHKDTPWKEFLTTFESKLPKDAVEGQ